MGRVGGSGVEDFQKLRLLSPITRTDGLGFVKYVKSLNVGRGGLEISFDKCQLVG